MKQNGYKPGVISRGYGGAANAVPQAVTADSDPDLVGDEAVILARRCACPVFIGSKRVAAAKALLASHACDVIISDDGLQHYALQRDIEIVVMDGERRFGNGYCLPVGPLREPPERIKTGGYGGCQRRQGFTQGRICHALPWRQASQFIDGRTQTLAISNLPTVMPLPAIGNPARFFDRLYAGGC